MRNWISKINCLALVMLFFFAGCQQKQEKILDVIDREPNLATIRIPSDYEARSIETTGGLNAWTKIKKLQLDCLATFYQPDGSFYLTEQQYIIYPWSNSIDVFGREPQGNFAWRLSQGQFEVLQGNRQIANIMTSIDNQYFTEAILGSVTAPVRLLDNSMEFTRDPNPINIQGKWYYPIERRINTDIESILRTHKTVFYQNRDNSIIDMVQIAYMGGEKSLSVRGYDYSEINNGDIIIPHRIEIFLTDSQGNSQKRLVKIDIK